jgi:hypothetical protein
MSSTEVMSPGMLCLRDICIAWVYELVRRDIQGAAAVHGESDTSVR